MDENINHPKHYCIEGRKECIDEMVDEFGLIPVITWASLTVYKYLYRCGLKDGESEQDDLKKAKWYAEWALNAYEKHSGTINDPTVYSQVSTAYDLVWLYLNDKNKEGVNGEH